jgi:Uma2 family endonuclease
MELQERPVAGASAQAPMIFDLASVLELSADELFEICRKNREWRIERNARGEIIIMPPVGGETSEQNAELVRQLGNWAKADANGRVFDSSAGFVLANGAIRSPDAAWVRSARLAALSAAERKKFLPLCPDFVVEIRSPSDTLHPLEDKMAEYLANGAQLGWLIDPVNRGVSVYRPGVAVQRIEGAHALSAAPELPGFELDLTQLWSV